MFLVAATLVAVVSGVAEDQYYADNATCCPFLTSNPLANRRCIESVGEIPNCINQTSKCFYNNRWYEHEETVTILPEKCVKIWCEGSLHRSDATKHVSGPNTEYNWPRVMVSSLSPGLNCCVDGEQLYPNEYEKVWNWTSCKKNRCRMGVWHEESIENCDPDHVKERCWIMEKSYGGIYIEVELDCCCNVGGQVYACGEDISIYKNSCTKKVCQANQTREVIVDGCCVIDGIMYASDQVIHEDLYNCVVKTCHNGAVKESPLKRCCSDCNNILHPPNSVVEIMETNCILRTCSEDGSIEERSLMNKCGCCEMAHELHEEGEVLFPSECVNFVCTDSTWAKNETLQKCETCDILGDGQMESFRGEEKSLLEDCEYVLVKKTDGVQQISIQIIKAGAPFKSDVITNGPLTVRHSQDTTATVNMKGEVTVNGHEVKLPFSTRDKLIVWDDGDSINIITFSGYHAKYFKHHTMRAVQIHAPRTERNGTHTGMCWHYKADGSDEGSPPILSFVTPVKARKNCTVRERISDECKIVPWMENFCQYIMEMKTNKCMPWLHEEQCLQFMCRCNPGDEYSCFLMIQREVEQMCGPYLCTKNPKTLFTQFLSTPAPGGTKQFFQTSDMSYSTLGQTYTESIVREGTGRTPSGTPSSMASATASSMPSATASAMPSATASSMPSATASAVPSATASATAPATVSPTPSATASAMPSATASATAPATVSPTPSATTSSP